MKNGRTANASENGLKNQTQNRENSEKRFFWTIGKSLGAACRVAGWFFPMYFAGRLESGNVKEYEDAAQFAKELKMPECFDEMMEMARVEQEHEDFFKQIISRHRLLPITKTFFRWG